MLNKKQLSETDIKTKYITPAIEKAGWDKMKHFLEEVFFTAGKIYVRGKLTSRGKAKRADYILYYKPNIPIAVIEAKDNNHSLRAGIQQGQKSYSKTKTIQVKEFEPIKAWWNNRQESEVAWRVPIQTIIDRNFDLDIKNPTKAEETQEYSSTELMEMLSESFAKSNELLGQLKKAVQNS